MRVVSPFLILALLLPSPALAQTKSCKRTFGLSSLFVVVTLSALAVNAHRATNEFIKHHNQSNHLSRASVLAVDLPDRNPQLRRWLDEFLTLSREDQIVYLNHAVEVASQLPADVGFWSLQPFLDRIPRSERRELLSQWSSDPRMGPAFQQACTDYLLMD